MYIHVVTPLLLFPGDNPGVMKGVGILTPPIKVMYKAVLVLKCPQLYC